MPVSTQILLGPPDFESLEAIQHFEWFAVVRWSGDAAVPLQGSSPFRDPGVLIAIAFYASLSEAQRRIDWAQQGLEIQVPETEWRDALLSLPDSRIRRFKVRCVDPTTILTAYQETQRARSEAVEKQLAPGDWKKEPW